MNSILNSITRRGTFLGNSAGVLGMFSPAGILFVLHSAPTLQLWGTTGSIRPLTRFGANMTHSEVWQLVLSQALSSSLLVSNFLISLARSCTLSHRIAFFPSWGEACFGGSDCGLCICWGVELGQDARLRLYYTQCNGGLDTFVRDHISYCLFFSSCCSLPREVSGEPVAVK